MLTKLQVVFSVLIGLALVVFAAAILTNVNVPKVPNWVAIVVWSTFGVMVACCIGVVITLMLEYREKKEPDEEEEVEELPVEAEGELAAVGAASELEAGEGVADAEAEPSELHEGGGLEADAGEPFMHEETEMFSDEPAAEHEAAPHVDELSDLDVDFSEE